MQLLMTGVEELVINSPAAVLADGTKSETYALPASCRCLGFETRPVGTYVTLVVSLQVSNEDVDGSYKTLVTTTAVGGEYIHLAPVAAKFVRVLVTSSTGASRTGLVVGVVARK
jgi:hypothetical protein